MCRVHEKILQAGELCYMDTSASFEPLDSLITLIYTSCAVGAFPLGLFITSDELAIILEKSINLLKTILPSYAFFRRGSQVGPMVFITDDSNVERNALELCWPKAWRDSTKVNSNAIQKMGMENEFLVPNTKNTSFYLVNSVLGTCSCPVGLTNAPCKHQGAVAIKFCIAIFNFIPLLKPDDHMIYSYIALGYVSQDSSFYASLRTESAPQDQEFSSSSSSFNNNIDKIIEQREPSGKNEEIDIFTFTVFLDDAKTDYQNGGKTMNPMTRVKGGANIRVQIKSIKRRKMEGDGVKRRLPIPTNEGKENLDPHAIIPA
ncbi:hypothetical protein C1646_750388 [Rhizophagus diaphanus]|nr:hypothetical protein C1646_750388 [Rhizophagus diaphanus] [Rhizophagus sp. MUCL 43196]